MKPWPSPLLLASAALASTALAGGVEGPALPRLSLDARTVGRSAEVQTVQGVPRADGPIFFFPTHVRAVLNKPGQRWQPQYETELPGAYVAVYPVAGLLAQYPERGQPYQLGAQIDTLRALNSGRLRLNEVRWPLTLPFLPLVNANQYGTGAVQTFRTPALQGLRYLAVYSQEEAVLIERERVFYTFQGLSRDGRFYITVQVPYAPASLPTRAEQDRTKNYDVAPYPAESRGKGPVYAAYQQKIKAYRADLTRKLNAEEGKTGLQALDALVRSIRLR